MYAEPATRLGPRPQLATDGGNPFAHADKTVPGTQMRGEISCRWGCRRPALIHYVDRQAPGRVSEPDSSCCAWSVLQDVCEGLLDDAVGGQLDHVRERAEGVRGDPVHLDARGGERVDQTAQFVQGRRRCGR
jgi:hypothetical protein